MNQIRGSLLSEDDVQKCAVLYRQNPQRFASAARRLQETESLPPRSKEKWRGRKPVPEPEVQWPIYRHLEAVRHRLIERMFESRERGYCVTLSQDDSLLVVLMTLLIYVDGFDGAEVDLNWPLRVAARFPCDGRELMRSHADLNEDLWADLLQLALQTVSTSIDDPPHRSESPVQPHLVQAPAGDDGAEWSIYMTLRELCDLLDCDERKIRELYGEILDSPSRQRHRFRLDQVDVATVKRYESWRAKPKGQKKPRGTSANSRKQPQTPAD